MKFGSVVYNVTRQALYYNAILLQWKISKYYIFWGFICSLWYPACNAHASYCPLLPALQCLSTLSYKRHDFRKNFNGA